MDKEMCLKHKGKPEIKIVLGAVLFLLSWLLEASAVKTLWMVLTAVLTLYGVVCLIKVKGGIGK